MREALLATLAVAGVTLALWSLNHEPGAVANGSFEAPRSGWVKLTTRCPSKPPRSEWRRAQPDEDSVPRDWAGPEPETRGSVTTAYRRP